MKVGTDDKYEILFSLVLGDNNNNNSICHCRAGRNRNEMESTWSVGGQLPSILDGWMCNFGVIFRAALVDAWVPFVNNINT